MKKIQGSIVAYEPEHDEDYYLNVSFKDTLSVDKIGRDYLQRRRPANSMSYWVRLHSNAGGQYHYPMFDFDTKVDVRDIVYREGLSGHIYSTAHGYHFFADGLMTLNECYLHGLSMGCDQKYLDLSKERGFFAIRCGRKKDREYDDIVYIGHTSGDVIDKSVFLRVHDAICNRLSLLYEREKRRVYIPFQFDEEQIPFKIEKKEVSSFQKHDTSLDDPWDLFP